MKDSLYYKLTTSNISDIKWLVLSIGMGNWHEIIDETGSFVVFLQSNMSHG